MARPKNEDNQEPEVTFDADRPTLPDNATTAFDGEKLSHNWQPDSPAVDLRQVGVTGPNVIADLEAQLKAAKDAKADAEKEVVSQEEYDRRTKLDVSDPQYINPSLDHVKVK